MVDAATLKAATPLVAKMIKGESVSFNDLDIDRRPYALWQRDDFRYYNYNDAPPQSVAVHTVIGTITKYGFCGGGTEGLMQQMKEADDHKNISAHLIEIDSGGGEATNIESVARFIKNDIKKPIVAWYNGTCASAAYYIAAAADEVFSSEPTDIVGSIGTYIGFQDLKGYFELNGITIHEIYADQSTLKNIDFKEALNGNYDPIKEGLLNPYAQTFINTISEFRNITDEDAFKGKVYMTNEAIEIGLIDGMKTWDEAANHARELGQQFVQSQNSLSMTYPRIEAVIGTTFEVHDGGVFLNESQLELIERSIAADGFEAVETNALTKIQESMGGFAEQLGKISDQLEQNTSAIEQNTKDIKSFGDQPGASPAAVSVSEDADALTDSQKAWKADVAEMTNLANEGKNPFTR